MNVKIYVTMLSAERICIRIFWRHTGTKEGSPKCKINHVRTALLR